MNGLTLYIKDLTDGKVRKYGEDPHDSLKVDDGILQYENLQNGDGSPFGYCFCNADGSTDWLEADGTEKYMHIGKISGGENE